MPVNLDFIKKVEEVSEIAIPSPDFLRKTFPKPTQKEDGELIKHKNVYEKFCQWSGLPSEVREPKTEVAFEKKWKIPRNYCQQFKGRSDFKDKRLMYFWDWMMEVLPDVVYSQYVKVKATGNTPAAEFFAKLVAKKLEVDKPIQEIKSLTIVGVPQENIEKLFTPKGFEDTKGLIPFEKE